MRGWIGSTLESFRGLFNRARELLRPYYLRWIHFRVRPAKRPSYFVNCWAYPNIELTPASLPKLWPDKSVLPPVLFWPMTDWHFRIQRTQHLALAFAARGHHVYIVNPHLGRQFGQPYYLDRVARVAVLARNVFEIHARLSMEPVYHHRLLTECEAERLAETLAALSVEPEVIQVVALPTWMRAAEILRRKFGWRIVYDCHDLLSGFRDMAAEIVAMETHTMTSADLVLFSAKSLRNLQQSDSIVKHEIVRNAVDFHHFASTVSDRASRPTAVRTAVYWGAIDDWFETGWIASAAASFHDVQFVIAGAVQNQPAGRALSMVSNIQLLGELPYTQLPSLAANADVGLIPFRRNALTLATNPIKLYEYFSHGLPVAATRLPETEVYDGLIYPASSCSEFVDQLGCALAEDPDDIRRRARTEIAKRESWDKRVEQILEALEASMD